jgi:tol-pal system protein YbgF
MRKPSLVVFVSAVVISALAAATPARAQNREHLQMAAELRILQQQNQELANTLAQTIQLLSETAKALNGRIDQTNESMKKGFADQSITLNTTAGDVRKTLAQTQDAATRLGELKEEVEALRTSIPALISRLTPAPDPSFAPDPNAVSAVGGAAAAAGSQAPSTIGLSPERMYNTAMSDFGAGTYAAAIQGFQEFLKAFPTSPRADDAQQFIGDSEFLQNHFEQAITAYNLVIQNYPKGDQVAWAYYKRGLAQSRLQQTAAARVSFETAVKLFPETEPGIMSLSRLQSLDNATAPAPATPPRKP